MYRLRHPFSGHIYGALGDGLVQVEKDGRRGIFDRYGFWVRGDIRHADAEMCRWLGTHDQALPSRHSAGFKQAGSEQAESERGEREPAPARDAQAPSEEAE